MQVAVRVVVAIRLVVLGISQPPVTAVLRLPLPLLGHAALHGILRATATAVFRTSHVHDQVRPTRIVLDVLAQGIVHQSKIALVARREDLVPTRTRIRLGAPPHRFAIVNPVQITRSVTLDDNFLGYAV